MTIINTSIFSIFDSPIILLRQTPAQTSASGDRVPAYYTAIREFYGDLQDGYLRGGSGGLIQQSDVGIYHSGGMQLWTEEQLELGDRLRISGELWEVTECATRARLLEPGRDQYLIKRLEAANK